jgi:hypothetical protein
MLHVHMMITLSLFVICSVGDLLGVKRDTSDWPKPAMKDHDAVLISPLLTALAVQADLTVLKCAVLAVSCTITLTQLVEHLFK